MVPWAGVGLDRIDVWILTRWVPAIDRGLSRIGAVEVRGAVDPAALVRGRGGHLGAGLVYVFKLNDSFKKQNIFNPLKLSCVIKWYELLKIVFLKLTKYFWYFIITKVLPPLFLLSIFNSRIFLFYLFRAALCRLLLELSKVRCSIYMVHALKIESNILQNFINPFKF